MLAGKLNLVYSWQGNHFALPAIRQNRRGLDPVTAPKHAPECRSRSDLPAQHCVVTALDTRLIQRECGNSAGTKQDGGRGWRLDTGGVEVEEEEGPVPTHS